MKKIHKILALAVTLYSLFGVISMSHAAPVNNSVTTVPAGTVVPVRMIDQISSDLNQAGQTFRASLDAPIIVGGRTVFPRGATAYVELVQVRTAGKIKGRNALVLQLVRIRSGNRTYQVRSNDLAFRGASEGNKTAKNAGIGAAVGGGLGALLGGGSGAAVGAGLGAGAGVATRYAKEARPVIVTPESRVNFRLTAPVQVGR